jgi:FMN phosphatase YigB (HAD superfamily)
MFLLDVDNTLLDNDGAKRALDAALRNLLGATATDHFWRTYEAIRHEVGMVNIPLTLARFETELGLTAATNDALASRARRFALADLLIDFPFDRYLIPDALAVIAHLRRLGRVAILSDGDPTFQPAKIWRAGLDAAVAGHVLVFDHKEDHLAEVRAACPADHYVLVEDKPEIVTAVRQRLPWPLTTVLVRQGRYAASIPPGHWPGADLTLDRLGELLAFDGSALVEVATAHRQG